MRSPLSNLRFWLSRLFGGDGAPVRPREVALVPHRCDAFWATIEAVSRQDGCLRIAPAEGAPLLVELEHVDLLSVEQPGGAMVLDEMTRVLVGRRVVVASGNGWIPVRGSILPVQIWLEDGSINAGMVLHGMAWARRDAPPYYQNAMAQARNQGVGIWREDRQERPEAFRARRG